MSSCLPMRTTWGRIEEQKMADWMDFQLDKTVAIKRNMEKDCDQRKWRKPVVQQFQQIFASRHILYQHAKKGV